MCSSLKQREYTHLELWIKSEVVIMLACEVSWGENILVSCPESFREIQGILDLWGSSD